MKIYNPTPDNVLVKFDGKSYIVNSGHYISVTDEAGKWVVEKFKQYGLVDITLNPPIAKDFNYKNFIGMKTLEGLEAYLANPHTVMESFI